jgi:catechol 2,3-dioxygenase-like lactoylglutathione lyase family enzyme
VNVIDHISLRVTNIQRSKEFYVKALAPLGYAALMEFPGFVGLGAGGKPDLWLTEQEGPTTVHVAFRAEDKAAVDAFHAAALAAGAKDNGAPGKRAQYHPRYYGAFVLDPDGHNIEAVIHNAE